MVQSFSGTALKVLHASFKLRNFYVGLTVFLSFMSTAGCSEERAAYMESPANLKNESIYFAHQSVGNDIITGLEQMKAKNKEMSELAIIEGLPADAAARPGIYHAKNGKNSDPLGKVAAFKKTLVEDGVGGRVDTALVKLCYVDFKPNTNVDEVFQSYASAIAEIKKTYPKLRIVHVTVPLYAHAYGFKAFLKSFIQEDTGNIKRNQFNHLLVEKFGDVDPVFDLAAVESTKPDGSRVSFKSGGHTYYALAKEYTTDGGHLNEVGRQRAAAELLKVLAR